MSDPFAPFDKYAGLPVRDLLDTLAELLVRIAPDHDFILLTYPRPDPEAETVRLQCVSNISPDRVALDLRALLERLEAGGVVPDRVSGSERPH